MKAFGLITSCVGVLMIFLHLVVFATSAHCAEKAATWLATGHVASIDGSDFCFRDKNDHVYTIKAGEAKFFVNNSKAEMGCLRVGDCVRVFGRRIGEDAVKAERIRVLSGAAAVGTPCACEEVKPEIKVVVEKPAPVACTEGAGPCVIPEPTTPAWEGRGMISDIDANGGRIKFRTSSGQFSVSVGCTIIGDGGKRIGLGCLSIGDAIKVRGFLVGQNEIDGREIRLMRSKNQSESALPQTPVSVAGRILQIDYPSMTFTMTTPSVNIVVVADSDTCVQDEHRKACFAELKPGYRVKMSGYGSPATGYAAQHIQIISVSP